MSPETIKDENGNLTCLLCGAFFHWGEGVDAAIIPPTLVARCTCWGKENFTKGRIIFSLPTEDKTRYA